MVRKCLRFLVALPLLFLSVCAQERPTAENQTIPGNLLSLNFEKLIDTYAWLAQTNYHVADSQWQININESFRRRLLLSNALSLQDEYGGDIGGTYRVDSRWNVRSSLHSSIVSDSKSIDLARLSEHRWLLGTEYSPSSGMQAIALAGIQVGRQSEESERGLAYLLGINAPSWTVEDLSIGVESRWEESRLEKRTPHDGLIRMSIGRDFDEHGADSLVITFGTQRREFFIGASEGIQNQYHIRNNIFGRQLKHYDAGNYLSFRPVSTAELSLATSVAGRSITRSTSFKDYSNPTTIPLDTRIDEFAVAVKANGRWDISPWIQAHLDFSHTVKDERHDILPDHRIPLAATRSQQLAADRLENSSTWSAMGTRWFVAISPIDSVRFTASVNALHYDTPDSTNNDDRDELMMIGGVQYTHIWSPALLTSVEADVNLSHLVYLKGEQSANNTWNRVIRLALISDYRPTSRFATRLQAEVMANYTVFDFDAQAQQVRSYSFRQVQWSDSTVFRVNSKFRLDFVGSLRLFQRGLLRWSGFREYPENEFREISFWPRCGYTDPHGKWLFSFGARYFLHQRYGMTAGRKGDLELTTSSYGPTAAIELHAGGFQVQMEGWKERQVMNAVITNSVANLTLRVQAEI